MSRPLIMVSNDDGITSPHLTSLTAALESVAEVLVVAPERQRSAASHAITLHKPLRITTVAPGRYALSGTPADCVYVGMFKLATRCPDLVLSGINDGYNLGTDVFYSGTVAGAVEGALRGSVGVALSLAHGATDLTSAVDFTIGLVRALLARPASPGLVFNVNIPASASGRYQWTRLGRRVYADDVSERLDPRGRPYYWIGGGASGHDDIAGSDCNAVASGIISVTPMHLNLTHHGHTDEPSWQVSGYERI
jgi:5'-nucleotidase